MYNLRWKSGSSMVKRLVPILVSVLSVCAAGQSPPPPAPTAAQATAASPTLANVPDLEPILAQVEQVAQAARLDLAQLRIEKWKTDAGNRRELQSNADLIQRNLGGTLPGMVAAARSAPQDFAPNFRLYQNLNALNDVMGRLAEYAGAYGPKSDYDQLAKDTAGLDSVRRALGDRIYNLATNRDAEVARLRSLLAAAKAAAPPPVHKVVVDDDAPVAKAPSKKKKKVAPPPQSSSPSSQPSTPASQSAQPPH